MNSKLSASLRKSAIIGVSVGALTFGAWGTANASDYYQQFGGKAGITALINTFVGNVANDPHINYYFAHANIPALKFALVNQVCMAVGGPCKYTGPNMTDAHRGMQITTAAFNYLSQDMINAMDAHRIPIGAQNYLLSLLAPMEPQIVTATGPLG
ncbi:group 1 truncated hemoglobin [Acidithiobacillus sp. CV18-2]|uniref:Group 1 truncated hemoglobin n=1 Tax=Igneacidithiobacillus copahuensis TaxID=2724909 RepID=A0AAE2YML6_9PROT|nr:group 1 truncated hemoglobin [Igneacidithiobacillus copahuensis]MBU2755417.1 group 1 truncated hemoglobin [Acidithiobacillus sp. CV18-3]MBU2757947.1 group 1 truncated hemoglobin [Acidithiobacillus sp. BN09-2]MBU2778312.1 group 1 truncated hemoglobin [Acidithiobacillus sp. CV18-2]MBU2797148.1 group 1 truncated hemoglobin [Acidithiobacillus sp. VAN18-2]MBU2798566.1 group 1 truncated hemoglobin [Acidithiobacillus sp. VAN18-4]UTV81503.1 group 1 truncated hemoglobin [Acidithiobacillus sp. YTS05